MANAPGLSALAKVEAVIRNPAIYALAELIPEPSRERGGRARCYPAFAVVIYEALVSVYGSARQVEAELSHPVVWRLVRKTVREMFPNDESMWLPRRPMRRHHYLYLRDRYLTRPHVLEAIGKLHREIATGQARELGLLDDDGQGSFTHPHLSRMLYADGKVITPLFRARAGDTRVDKTTGEIRELRHEPDAALHFEANGEAFGTKFVMVAARSDEVRGRIIVDVEVVPKPGAEAEVAMTCFERTAPLVPGAHGIIYDTALRGVHHQKLLRELGLLPVNRVTAKHKGAKAPRRAPDRRVEKSTHVEDKTITLSDGSTRIVSLFARGGAIGVAELSETGEPVFTELRRIRTHRNRDKSGLYRWYNDYELPEELGGGTVTVRLHGNEDDVRRRFNRTENVRPIPPADPDFARLYPRRNDAESINRALDDSMWLARAHSIGHARQHLNLIGYALVVNSVALAEHRRRREPLAA